MIYLTFYIHFNLRFRKSVWSFMNNGNRLMHIDLYNIAGAKLEAYETTGVGVEIIKGNKPSGIYFLKVINTTSKSVETLKFMIE